MDMENMFRRTFGKLEMEDSKKNEIRRLLEEKQSKTPTWVKYAACAAVCMALLLGIPSTRGAIVQAAGYITNIFRTANGSEVVFEKTDNTMKFSIEYSDQGYTRVMDGRLYLTVGDECIDVTDQCGENSYYRYEAANDDGGKSVILVGGTVENNGWVELVFDADGNYVFNQMKVEADSSGRTPDWVNQAMHQEGVPCGDPVLDRELEE